jgi:methylmalonyl-CoA/ethylmalonyl-CoA epimerase
MQIDHIGIVVPSLDEAILHWQKVFGYRQHTRKVENSRQKVYVVFLKKEGSLPVKLLEPVDKTSPIYHFAKRGGGLHHLCFKCDNLKQEMRRMEKLGLRVLTPPEPGEAFANEDIAFIYAQNGLNIELIDTDKRASIID